MERTLRWIRFGFALRYRGDYLYISIVDALLDLFKLITLIHRSIIATSTFAQRQSISAPSLHTNITMALCTRSITRASAELIYSNTRKARVSKKTKKTNKTKTSCTKKAPARPVVTRTPNSVKLDYICPNEHVQKSLKLNFSRTWPTKVVFRFRALGRSIEIGHDW